MVTFSALDSLSVAISKFAFSARAEIIFARRKPPDTEKKTSTCASVIEVGFRVFVH
jgi:hypothetical protein